MPHRGALSTVPSRLAGWWLASAVSVAAVLLLSPKSPGDRLRTTAAASATALAAQLEAVLRGAATPAHLEASVAAKHELMTLFAATPYRPTGLATADQGLANVVQLLEWCTALISDALDGHLELSQAAQADRELLTVAVGLLRAAAALLTGQDAEPDLDRLERARAASAAYQRALSGDPDSVGACARQAFHAQVIAVAVRTIAADTLIATRRASPQIVAIECRGWYGGRQHDPPADRGLGAPSGSRDTPAGEHRGADLRRRRQPPHPGSPGYRIGSSATHAVARSRARPWKVRPSRTGTTVPAGRPPL